jgi:hypothetical protein
MSHTPPSPQYILRGHSSTIHALHIFRQNTRLISADADGYLVIWATDSKRAVAVWKGHEGAVLGVASWGEGDGASIVRCVLCLILLQVILRSVYGYGLQFPRVYSFCGEICLLYIILALVLLTLILLLPSIKPWQRPPSTRLAVPRKR